MELSAQPHDPVALTPRTLNAQSFVKTYILFIYCDLLNMTPIEVNW